MSKIRSLGLAWLMVFILACQGITVVMEQATTPSPDLQATAEMLAAQTLAAVSSPAAPSTAGPAEDLVPTTPAPVVFTATPAPLPTATPLPPPTPTPTDTPPPQATFTAHTPTRCRQGPGVYYPEVGMVDEGQRVPILARTDQIEGYWLVQLPDGRTCWAWDRYATVEGNAAALPLATPPPAPAAAFSLFYIGYAECGTQRGLTFEIVNRGEEPIESVYVEVRSGQGTFSASADLQFRWWLDCSRKGSANTILPHRSVWITVPTGTTDLRGTSITVYARACTADYQHGECFERQVPFSP